MTQIVEQTTTAIVLIDAPPHLELRRESIVVPLAEGLRVVDGALQGQRGPQGEQGVAGVAGAAAYEEITIPGVIPATYELAHEPLEASLNVFVNGLRQHGSAFTLTGPTVSLLADLQLVEADLLAFVYAY